MSCWRELGRHAADMDARMPTIAERLLALGIQTGFADVVIRVALDRPEASEALLAASESRAAAIQEALERVSRERDEARAEVARWKEAFGRSGLQAGQVAEEADALAERLDAAHAENAALRHAMNACVAAMHAPEERRTEATHVATDFAREALSTPPHGGLGPEAARRVMEVVRRELGQACAAATGELAEVLDILDDAAKAGVR